MIIVDDNTEAAKKLMVALQSVGRDTVCAENIQAAQDLCEDPLCQPIIICSQHIEAKVDYSHLPEFCLSYLIVVALDDQDRGKEARYFRMGVADILEADTGQRDFPALLDRLSDIAQQRSRQHSNSDQLQKANSQLQQSLDILQQDQKAGIEIQKSLMPESPLRCGNFEISHSTAPSLYLSGDCVGYQFVLGRYILFYFVDVSGHGASSAFVTVLLHFITGRIIRRHTREKEFQALAQAPEGLVESINQQLLNIELGKHLTIVAGSLDTETRRLRYVVGAQQPSPVLIVDGVAKYLPGKGKPAGIFKDAKWVVEQIDLPEKFALVLLSDGVFELLPGDEIIDKEDRLLRYLSNRSVSIKALKRGLFIDGIKDLQDDISVLLLTGGC